MVKGGFSFNSRRTMRVPQNLVLTTHNSKAKVISKSFELDTNASQACPYYVYSCFCYVVLIFLVSAFAV